MDIYELLFCPGHGLLRPSNLPLIPQILVVLRAAWYRLPPTLTVWFRQWTNL